MNEPTLACCTTCGALRAPELAAACFCGATETKPAAAAKRSPLAKPHVSIHPNGGPKQ
jgi:hypothetical protein